MPFIALAIAVIIAIALVGFALHLLFSPWILVALVALLAWTKFRPRANR
jgi:hypothetical protein